MKKDSTHVRQTKKSNKGLKTVVVILAILVLLALAFLAYLLFAPEIEGFIRSVFPSPAPSAEVVVETPPPAGNTISFIVPQDKSFSITVYAGESFDMPEGPEIAGYTFLAWINEGGSAETCESIAPTGNMAFSALYAVAFKNEKNAEKHMPYLSLDENAMFRPNEGITRGEALQIIYEFLDLSGVGSGYFIDVSRDDPLYTAAATLKDLDLIGGQRLHPEDTVTYGEFFTLLAKLFPAAKEEHDFSKVPNGSENYASFCVAYERGWLRDPEISPYDLLPRKEFARIVNMLIGRSGAEHTDTAAVGTILDVAVGDEYYRDIAEAVVEHTLSSDGSSEIWTGSKPIAILKPGFFFIGSELHCIKDDGNAAVGETVNNFLFDDKGVVSTGDAALDELVRNKVAELVDPATMSREEMLKILYDFVLYDSFYLGGDKYATGETGWETAKAYQMLSTGKGNCYAYAATFWALSRAIGYDAVCYSGSVGTHSNPHAWVEINIDGTTYIFDPTLEYEQWYGPGTHTFERFFMKTYASVSGWLYNRG